MIWNQKSEQAHVILFNFCLQKGYKAFQLAGDNIFILFYETKKQHKEKWQRYKTG